MIKKIFVLSSVFCLVAMTVSYADNNIPAASSAPVIMPAPPANPVLGANTNNSATPTPNPQIPRIPEVIPPAPNIDAKAYILIDAKSGYVIAQKNAQQQLPPASLTKLMTIYLTFDALRRGQIHLEDNVLVSEKAWRTGGSRMFIKVGSKVPVSDLLDGVIVASGNDAAEALAEFVAGSDTTFVDNMNQMAAALGMVNTHYMDPTGLPDPSHHSTAYDLALLARALVLNFPNYYPMFKVKYITYNKIRQPNRNSLLWSDTSVDGFKTGHTEEAGYCLIASAERSDMRLISVVLGATSSSGRANGSEALLNYGFRYYQTRKLYSAGTHLAEPRTWYGAEKRVPMGVMRDFYVTLPKGESEQVSATIVYNKKLTAPIQKGQAYGTVNVVVNNKVVAAEPLVALADNPKGGTWASVRDYVVSMFKKP